MNVLCVCVMVNMTFMSWVLSYLRLNIEMISATPSTTPHFIASSFPTHYQLVLYSHPLPVDASGVELGVREELHFFKVILGGKVDGHVRVVAQEQMER